MWGRFYHPHFIDGKIKESTLSWYANRFIPNHLWKWKTGSRYLIFQPIPPALDQARMHDQRNNSISFPKEILVLDRHPSIPLGKCGIGQRGRHVFFFFCLLRCWLTLRSSLLCVVSMFLLEYNNYPASYNAQSTITRILKFLLLIVFVSLFLKTIVLF